MSWQPGTFFVTSAAARFRAMVVNAPTQAAPNQHSVWGGGGGWGIWAAASRLPSLSSEGTFFYGFQPNGGAVV